MGYTLDNQTLLYIIIALFVVQLFVMRYYVQSSIEESEHKNNKKVIKKLTGQINATFDHYMGGNRQMVQQERIREEHDTRRPHRDDMDSIDDPAEYVEEEDPQAESDE